MSDAVAGTDPIYVLDDIHLKPGMLDAFLASMRAHYLPGAEARGQVLVHTWVTPPTTTKGIPIGVVLVWRLEGVSGFWRMRSQNSTPEVVQWWSDCETFIDSRSRRFAATPGSLPAFEALGRLNE
jgi:hypothetical protein